MSTTTGSLLTSTNRTESTSPQSPSARKPKSHIRYVELGSEQLQNWLDGQSTDRRAARDLLVEAFRDSPDQAELYSQGPAAPRAEFDALLYQSIAPGSRFILAYESSGPVSTHISHGTSDGNDTQAKDAQESATYGSSLTGVKSKSKLVGIACSTLNLTTVLDNESNIPEPLRAARAEFDGFTGSTNTQVSSWYDPRTIYKYCRDLYHHDRPARSSRYISAVAVDSSYQGCGVGRSMLDRLAGGDQAPSGMSLHAESHMVPYYQKLGYRVSSETPYNPQGNPDDLASTSYFMHRPDPRTGSTAASLVAYANSAWDWMSCQSSRMAGQCGWSAISETASRIIRAGPWAKSHSD